MLDIHPSAKPPGKVKKLSRRTLSVDQEQHVTRVHENSRMTDDRNDADAHCMKMHGESSGSRHEDGCQVILRKAWKVRPAPSYQCRLSPAPALLNHSRNRLFFAALGSLALHLIVLALAGSNQLAWLSRKPDVPKDEKRAIFLDVVPWAPEKGFAVPTPRLQASATAPAAVIATGKSPRSATTPVTARPLATQPAPAAPTAEEWAFAGQYTLKNSKGYRYSWGKQVRSMMGTAVEGQGAGEVRFRVEIAPDGTLAGLETLWTTSSVAEQLARKAIESMPPCR